MKQLYKIKSKSTFILVLIILYLFQFPIKYWTLLEEQILSWWPH